MSINDKDWQLLAVVADGERLSIDGVNICMETWAKLDVGELEVLHPSHRNQRHRLWIYCIEKGDRTILFAAGELSSCVWCFYVPKGGQPCVKSRGMTVNELLFHSGLSKVFDDAILSRNNSRAIDLLITSGLSRSQAQETVAEIVKKPQSFGYGGVTHDTK